MVYALYKFKHFFVGKQICLLCRPHGSGILGQQTIGVWKDRLMVVIFLEYEFIVIYKSGKTRVVIDDLSRLQDSSKGLGIPNQTIDASLFFVEPMWMEEVKSYLETS
jgi:hypothetical protein